MSAAIETRERRVVERLEHGERQVRAVEYAPDRYVWRKPGSSWEIRLGVLYGEDSLEVTLYGSDTSPQVDPRALEALRWLDNFDGARP